jgi:hypothetical protein
MEDNRVFQVQRQRGLFNLRQNVDCAALNTRFILNLAAVVYDLHGVTIRLNR